MQNNIYTDFLAITVIADSPFRYRNEMIFSRKFHRRMISRNIQEHVMDTGYVNLIWYVTHSKSHSYRFR